MEKDLMDKEVLCILDTRQIQRYMFRSNTFLDTVGGSECGTWKYWRANEMKGISIDKIPKKGLVMAYFRNELLFLPYEVAGDELKMPGGALFDKEMPYECHFFNKDMEYRLIRRESRNDVIERILTKDEEEKMESDLLFPEEVLVKKEYTDIPGIPEKLRVINRYHYSENDTLVLKDYRIAAP